MSDVQVYGAAENGSYVGASPRVDLAGTVPSGYTIGQIFANGMADQETATITIRQDEANWAVYRGARFNDLATDTFDLSVATLLESAGTIADGAVEVLGLAPAVPDVDGSEVIDWQLRTQNLGSVGGGTSAVDLDLGHHITATLTDDQTFNFTSGRGHPTTQWTATIACGAFTPSFQFGGVAIDLPADYDIATGSPQRVEFSCIRSTLGVSVSERRIP